MENIAERNTGLPLKTTPDVKIESPDVASPKRGRGRARASRGRGKNSAPSPKDSATMDVSIALSESVKLENNLANTMAIQNAGDEKPVTTLSDYSSPLVSDFNNNISGTPEKGRGRGTPKTPKGSKTPKGISQIKKEDGRAQSIGVNIQLLLILFRLWFKHLSANPTKCSNTLKQFVGKSRRIV